MNDYKLREREAGSGPLRVGEAIEFREDLYSMFYVSVMKAEFIYFWKNVHDVDPKVKERKMAELYAKLDNEDDMKHL